MTPRRPPDERDDHRPARLLKTLDARLTQAQGGELGHLDFLQVPHPTRLRHRPGRLDPPAAPHGRETLSLGSHANNPVVPTTDEIQTLYAQLYG
ncbi:hypothetical protein SSPO_005670 [Streptomyces antimycoticus]|uniref:Uncharacterized protein n=1 Tax=Streptomyces antimycoticus TaxID=68175 RepID=A0A499UL51_9ACTN|nr:hypothetical protein SSPO_005670 [Streptomyces antimycoticus]